MERIGKLTGVEWQTRKERGCGYRSERLDWEREGEECGKKGEMGENDDGLFILLDHCELAGRGRRRCLSCSCRHTVDE